MTVRASRSARTEHRFVAVELDRARLATITVSAFSSLAESLDAARELDAAILDLRFNYPSIGTWVLRTVGEIDRVTTADEAIAEEGWLEREVRLLWKRTLKRLDMSARSLVALVDSGQLLRRHARRARAQPPTAR